MLLLIITNDYFPPFSLFSDCSSFSSITWSLSCWSREGLLKSGNSQSTRASHSKSAHQLFKLLSIRSRGELGRVTFTAGCFIWWNVWWHGHAAWKEKSSCHYITAILVVVDTYSVCQVSRNNVHHRIYWWILLCDC